MSLIFYDLETTDKEPCGQILNFCFIRTDNDFNFEDELSGEIKLSVLQIPSASALLTNRTKIIEHQESASLEEPQAMLEIYNFIANSISISKFPVTLIGYNSARFDLGFLRTSLIRNGINPYFSGKVKYHDILFLVRKAFIESENFPLTHSEDKLSLSLENVSKAFGLLTGKQSHHSRDDVLLSIELCKLLKAEFGIDPISYKAYEPLTQLCLQKIPDYELDISGTGSRSVCKRIYLFNENYRSALWLDLDRYAEGQGRAAISWFNKSGSQLIAEVLEPDERINELIDKAKTEFKHISVDNFFSRSTCDIEQDIYRLDMQKISKLHSFIWSADKSGISQNDDEDCRQLATRYWLAYGVMAKNRKDNWYSKLKEYAEYRYASGAFQLSKSVATEPNITQYHPTLKAILAETETLLSQKTELEDQEILLQLKNYILDSEIYKLICTV